MEGKLSIKGEDLEIKEEVADFVEEVVNAKEKAEEDIFSLYKKVKNDGAKFGEMGIKSEVVYIKTDLKEEELSDEYYFKDEVSDPRSSFIVQNEPFMQKPNEENELFSDLQSENIEGQTLENRLKRKRKECQQFSCWECRETFKYKHSLQEHYQSVHEYLKLLTCHACDSTFGDKRNLVRHIEEVHENLKPYKCSLCKSVFESHSDQVSHYKSVHEQLKPHKCSMCQGTYSTRGDLNSHIKSVHDLIKSKPYACSTCGKNFAYKESLISHIWIIHEKMGLREIKIEGEVSSDIINSSSITKR